MLALLLAAAKPRELVALYMVKGLRLFDKVGYWGEISFVFGANQWLF